MNRLRSLLLIILVVPAAAVAQATDDAISVFVDPGQQVSAIAALEDGRLRSAYGNLAWRSLDEGVAEVAPDGTVTGVSWGQTLIVGNEAGGQADSLQVVVMPFGLYEYRGTLRPRTTGEHAGLWNYGKARSGTASRIRGLVEFARDGGLTFMGALVTEPRRGSIGGMRHRCRKLVPDAQATVEFDCTTLRYPRIQVRLESRASISVRVEDESRTQESVMDWELLEKPTDVRLYLETPRMDLAAGQSAPLVAVYVRSGEPPNPQAAVASLDARAVTWRVGDPSVARIDEDEVLHALSAGTTELIATSTDGLVATGSVTVRSR